MADRDPGRRTRRLGLIVNPIAGLGGPVGLKGTDGPELVALALALGARPRSGERAAQALEALAAAWPATERLPDLLVAPGDMGETAAAAAGLAAVAVRTPAAGPTTADDTRAAAVALRDLGVDLLLFAGGDGTARDILAAVGESVAVLGIPSGVKLQSAVFAIGPAAAGRVAAGWLRSGMRRTEDREVADLAEGAEGADGMPRLHGILRVPAGRLVQARKAPSPAGEAAAMGAIGADVAAAMVPGHRYVLGPGTTVRAVAEALGVPKTLIGADVVESVAPQAASQATSQAVARAVVVAADASATIIREALLGRQASIVVTPVGGQGFLFGRGNQQIPPDIIRSVGREGLIVVATARKLAELGGRPLLVDTGDGDVDSELTGYVSVVTGYRERMVVGVRPA